MRVLFQLSMASALAIGAAAPAVAQDSDATFEACVHMSGAEQIAGCTALIDAGKLDDKERTYVFWIRAGANLHAKDYVRSIEDFSSVIRLTPKDSTAFLGRGAAYLMENDLARGIADFSEAIRLDPHGAVGFNNRGWAYYLLKNYTRAVADYDAAIKLNPRSAQSLYVRGLAKDKLGQAAASKADIASAIAIDPNIVAEMAKAMGAGG